MSWDWEKLKEQQQKRGGSPPQMEEILAQVKKIKVPGGPFLVVLVVLALFGTSMFYTVGVDEVGIVQRFGKYVRTSQPGLNFKWPAGIEKVTNVKVRRIFKEEFGFRSSGQDGQMRLSQGNTNNDVALILTGDLNVALVPWIVQYRIRDPYDYLFKVNNVNQLLRDMSEAAMSMVVGDHSINEVINKREEIADAAKKLLQEELDNAETGILVVTVELKRSNVPEPVQPSFNEVNQAIQDKEKLIYQAKEAYNKAIPAARGEAERTIKDAEGYALDRVNRAMGDATRFTERYNAYAKAKDVTRRRLYLEMIKNVFPKLGEKYIVDADQKSLLPLLNLGKGNGAPK